MKETLDSVMMRVLLGPLIAALQLFAVYVLVHGHYSPGGGFQAGVVLGASFVLPLLVLGRGAQAAGYIVLSQDQGALLGAVGVAIFAAISAAPMLFGGAFLDYTVLPLGEAASARHSLGILLIEVGVTLAVAGAVVAIFRALQEHDLLERDGEGAP